MNVAYYPQERGPYNLSTDVTFDGLLNNPTNHWGGMMCKLSTNDFEQANIEYIEFWLMDPFIYSNTVQTDDAGSLGGDLYINLGEISEDILRDGKKFYESGMPVGGTGSFTETQWGKVPVQATQTYAFATTSGSRALQDVGLNGLNDEEERLYPAYSDFLQKVNVNDSVRQAWTADPANDDYHYFRGSDLDDRRASILDRYKRINMPQGNSPDNDQQTESYDTSYKTYPDVEDINQDYTLNEYDRIVAQWQPRDGEVVPVPHSAQPVHPSRRNHLRLHQHALHANVPHPVPEAYRAPLRFARSGAWRVAHLQPAALYGQQQRNLGGECREY